jgi:hypothetical protein
VASRRDLFRKAIPIADPLVLHLLVMSFMLWNLTGTFIFPRDKRIDCRRQIKLGQRRIVLRGDKLGQGRQELLSFWMSTSSVGLVPTRVHCRTPARAIWAAPSPRNEAMLARAASRVAQCCVVACTVARRASSTWLNRCSYICSARRVCE